ncbi:MAG: DUF262 domain-containing protein [Ignavibacteriae bacterium]|nr:DUF262 domain-containing protein [Ignavibacteriota bacterium]
MSINFKHTSQSLDQTIKNASDNNASYVIPDLQRPYVWNPQQVILLVDSVFKGWPFGTLLLWEVKPDCFNYSNDEGIPHRPFWQIVDRTKDDKSTQASTIGQPATYFMVLDGQQRIQSLVLALGGDKWGFKLYDWEWALTMQDRRVKLSEHWSNAVLCLDLNKFAEELKEKHNVVRKIEVRKILDWAILDVNGRSQGKRQVNYEYPIMTSLENPGRFIRLSRFWDLAQTSLSENEYRGLLKPFLEEHSLSEQLINDLIFPLSEFMQIIEKIKNYSKVDSLQIDSFQLTPQWNKDDYSDAIVNIFTRLNTAGRTLTREEITLAWLKVGWDSSFTNGKTARECLDDLKEILEDNDFKIEIDEIVRLISFVWSIEDRGGNLLDSKDLLKGEVIRPMAKTVSSKWLVLISNLKIGIEIIKARNLVKVQGSFNSIIVFLTWHHLVLEQNVRISNDLKLLKKDSLEKQINKIAKLFLDRWVFSSQWANVWGEGAVLNFSNFAKDLNDIKNDLLNCTHENIIEIVNSSVDKLMGRLTIKAIDYINNTIVRNRSRVRAYYNMLWIWHRIDLNRWNYSSKHLRIGKTSLSLDVDHTIANAWWERKIKEIIDTKLLTFNGTEEEKELVSPSEFATKQEAYEFINLLGNCSLLEKSFNISKSDKSMKSFLEEVHEFKEKTLTIDKWEGALSINRNMTDPNGVELNDLIDTVRLRDLLIRRELIEFINGTKTRIDID